MRYAEEFGHAGQRAETESPIEFETASLFFLSSSSSRDAQLFASCRNPLLVRLIDGKDGIGEKKWQRRQSAGTQLNNTRPIARDFRSIKRYFVGLWHNLRFKPCTHSAASKRITNRRTIERASRRMTSPTDTESSCARPTFALFGTATRVERSLRPRLMRFSVDCCEAVKCDCRALLACAFGRSRHPVRGSNVSAKLAKVAAAIIYFRCESRNGKE